MKNKGLLIAALLFCGTAMGIFAARLFVKPAPALSSPRASPESTPSASLPALADSDELVRARAGSLSKDSSFQEWLKLEALVERLTAAMNRIAHGTVPRDIFSAFAPRGGFLVRKKSGKVYLDPAGFARYDALAAMAQSVDAVSAARIFEELLPLFDAAQRGLGEKNASARETFFAAARELLQAPALPEGVLLIEGKKGVGWAFADASYEGLSPAQKQLLRMGPKNQAALQAKLRGIALALGVPGSRL